ncbi:MAG: cobalamin biosynthesis protein, partial [Phototrophicales bacterium]
MTLLSDFQPLLSDFRPLLVVICALLLDIMFAEPRHAHPLVGFGNIAHTLEKHLNHHTHTSPIRAKLTGLLALVLAVSPWVFACSFLAHLLANTPPLSILFESFVLYLAIGWQSLKQHIMPIYCALKEGQISTARHHTSY